MIQKQTSTKRDKPIIAHAMSDASTSIPPPAKLRLDSDALISNWRALSAMSGQATAGAAVKADAYGLGAVAVVEQLLAAGCKDFFVANWEEAREIEDITAGKACVSVLNGVREEDMAFAVRSDAKPVLNSVEQVKRWSESGQLCDLMINSGMSRLGIDAEDLIGAGLDKLSLDIVMSHLASADEDVPQNREQLKSYRDALNIVSGKRESLANSAGIALGSDYHFSCTRPGLSLFGGRQRPELEGHIRQVAFPEAQILQVRSLKPGDRVGYNGTYVANRAHDVATLAMGYADGYLRGFSNKGSFVFHETELPVLGRVSMDLIAIDISDAPQLKESDWVECQYDLPEASAISGLSQYELITGLGQRLPREWR